jgi:hypothetical protein
VKQEQKKEKKKKKSKTKKKNKREVNENIKKKLVLVFFIVKFQKKNFFPFLSCFLTSRRNSRIFVSFLLLCFPFFWFLKNKKNNWVCLLLFFQNFLFFKIL